MSHLLLIRSFTSVPRSLLRSYPNPCEVSPCVSLRTHALPYNHVWSMVLPVEWPAADVIVSTHNATPWSLETVLSTLRLFRPLCCPFLRCLLHYGPLYLDRCTLVVIILSQSSNSSPSVALTSLSNIATPSHNISHRII